MIDVSSLTDLQAAIALLIERRGTDGRRVCELCKETKAHPKSVEKIVTTLLRLGYIEKRVGDVPRYFVPAVERVSPAVERVSPPSSWLKCFPQMSHISIIVSPWGLFDIKMGVYLCSPPIVGNSRTHRSSGIGCLLLICLKKNGVLDRRH